MKSIIDNDEDLFKKLPTLILGTRGSLLALTQAKLLIAELTAIFPFINVDIKIIQTQGDQIVDKPLWQLDGKDFFTKELDLALINNQVDFVIHSYKDLAVSRPISIELAAIAKRSFAEDILIIKNKTIEELKTKEELNIGTSSPRRHFQLQQSIKKYIPYFHQDLHKKIQIKNLRGNVNGRLSKLQNDEYDAIVLALAGLERLSSYIDSKNEIKKLLSDCNFMILHQSEFTAAPSQGALAVEINKDNKNYHILKKLFSFVHDEETAFCSKKEKEIFSRHGGGCHLALGVHARKIGSHLQIIENGIIEATIISQDTSTPLSESLSEPLAEPIKFSQKISKFLDESSTKNLPIFIGQNFESENFHFTIIPNFLIEKEKIPYQINHHQNIFVTSSFAYQQLPSPQSLWTAGKSSHAHLAKHGHWVNGSLDNLGINEMRRIIKSNFFKNFSDNQQLKVLTHPDSKVSFGEIIPSYKKNIKKTFSNVDISYQNLFLKTKIFYWGSYSQYEIYVRHFPFLAQLENVNQEFIFCCGSGKTFDQFKKRNIPVHPFINFNHFTQSLTKDLI